MLKMGHNFFCVATAFMFGGLGFLFAAGAHLGWAVSVNGMLVPVWLSWTVVGACFLMAVAGLHNVR